MRQARLSGSLPPASPAAQGRLPGEENGPVLPATGRSMVRPVTGVGTAPSPGTDTIQDASETRSAGSSGATGSAASAGRHTTAAPARKTRRQARTGVPTRAMATRATTSRAGESGTRAEGAVGPPSVATGTEPAAPASGSMLQLGSLLPRPALDFQDVWPSMGPTNDMKSELTAAGARAHPDRADIALVHLMAMAFGTTDVAIARRQSLLFWQTVKLDTRKTYGRNIIAFLEWCENAGVPIHFRFPTAANILAIYLQRDMASVRAGTVEKRAHGLQFWHRVQRMPWSWARTDASALRKTAKLECLAPLEQRRAVEVADLAAMARRRDREDPAQVAVWAAALMAFWAMCLPGEVTVRAQGDDHEDCVRWSQVVENPPAGPKNLASYGMDLPSDKTHGKRGFDRIAAAHPKMPELCPVVAVQRHREINALHGNEVDTQAGAFSYRATDGTRRELTASFFQDTLNGWLAAEGRARITGHCFRIGGASLYFAAGFNLADIKLRGGWESDTYLVYVRQNFVCHATMFGDLDPKDLHLGPLVVPPARTPGNTQLQQPNLDVGG